MSYPVRAYLELVGLKNQLEEPPKVVVEYSKTGCGQTRMQCPVCSYCVLTEETEDMRLHLLLEHLQVYTVPFTRSGGLCEQESRLESTWEILPHLGGTLYTDERVLLRTVMENKAFFGRLDREPMDKSVVLKLPCLAVEMFGWQTQNVCVFCCFCSPEHSSVMQHMTDLHFGIRMREVAVSYETATNFSFAHGHADGMPELSEVMQNQLVVLSERPESCQSDLHSK